MAFNEAEYARAYYLKNKEKITQRTTLWNKANPGKALQYNRATKMNDPVGYLLTKARWRSKRVGMECSILREDIIIPTHCPYLDIELTVTFGGGRIPSNMSLDRIDSTKGYIKGNVQVVSELANRMKNNSTPEQLLTFARNVIELSTRT